MAADKIIPLWPEDCDYNRPEFTPRLEAYLPDKPKDVNKAPVVIIFPGGGYGGLAPHEGEPFAQHFRSFGYVVFVLYYRVSPNRFPAPYADGCRGVRLVRENCEQFAADPNRVAIMGFSAGGHLVSTIATQPDLHADPMDDLVTKHSAKPDRLILGYPVISMGNQTHLGSVLNLLGEENRENHELRKEFSNELHVTENNPPVFVFHTADDEAVPVSNSLRFIQACRDKGVNTELHVFEHGPHGVGMAQDNPKLKIWVNLLDAWLDDF